LTLFAVAQAETIQLTGIGGEYSNGEAIGPYAVTVNGTTQAVVCDDLYIGIGMGHTWDANRLTWRDLPPQEQPLYGTAYWLVNSILTGVGPHADAQWALWHLFSPQAPLPGSASDALSWAQAQYSSNPGLTYDTLVIYRPDPRSSSQEMLAETPEPGTLVYGLIGLALLLAARMMFHSTGRGSAASRHIG
jgi:hypothetical protein